jgi:hypothetical protein
MGNMWDVRGAMFYFSFFYYFHDFTSYVIYTSPTNQMTNNYVITGKGGIVEDNMNMLKTKCLASF